jgi:DNA-binding transcriptional ArsR family regulator
MPYTGSESPIAGGSDKLAKGNLQVYGTVLKLNNVFKLSDVINATGLSKQLVGYHLKYLVNEGILERDDRKYVLVARQDLIELLMNVGEKVQSGLLPIPPERFDRVKTNQLVTTSILVSSAGMPGHLTLKSKLNTSIDDVIKEFQGLKQHLNRSRLNEVRAIKQIEVELEATWNEVGKLLEVDRAEFERVLLEKFEALNG